MISNISAYDKFSMVGSFFEYIKKEQKKAKDREMRYESFEVVWTNITSE